ncbi:helix-turn-helix domain-containing protein [Snodgrassella alvi]|uniref:helix-turn-helix domain-containing protein n=1 Tax=Snodgrassella alvi TaxID=1196083 RepID=UPI003D030A8B
MASDSENYSQSKQILDYLQAGNALTPLEALRKFNCLRLGARIYDLRQLGYQINSRLITDEHTKKRYASYRLV